MDHEEAAAVVFEESGPNEFSVRIGDLQVGDVGRVMPFEDSLLVGPGLNDDGLVCFEAEEEPMAGVFEGSFGNDSDQGEVVGCECDAGLFLDFPDGAFGGTFAEFDFEFASDW